MHARTAAFILVLVALVLGVSGLGRPDCRRDGKIGGGAFPFEKTRRAGSLI